MFRMAHDRMKAITANVELKREIQKRLDEPSPVVDTGLEFILLKLRGLDGLDIGRVNHAVALAKLRLAINMGEPRSPNPNPEPNGVRRRYGSVFAVGLSPSWLQFRP